MSVLNDITIGFEVRPCCAFIGDEERKALFHCWTQCKNPSRTQVAKTCALVETEDGLLHTVDPDWIVFLDSAGKFREYDFSRLDGGTANAAD